MRSGMLVVTQLFCPNGHNLVNDSYPARFNGHPGVVLTVEGQNTKGEVVVSPIHGDDTKFGESEFEPGEVTKIMCPTCGVNLPSIQLCGCVDQANLVGLYLTPDLEDGNQVAVCQSWGCLRSRVIDRFQILSKAE